MTTSTAKTIRMSATEAAAAWLKAKSVTAKKQIGDFVAARASESSRVRWTRLAKSMAEGDVARIEYYAATGADKAAAAAKLRTADKEADEAVAKVVKGIPLAKTRKPARKPAKKTPAKDEGSKAANLVAMLEQMDEGQMETFMTFAKLALKK